MSEPESSGPAEGVLPDFLIVGAMRAGTTALGRRLRQHPQVFMPDREVHFFNADRSYAEGAQAYTKVFGDADGKDVVGERTPAYSAHPSVPERIAGMLPHAKLVWILRNPVDRAYSHYWLFVQRGSEPRSFERAIEDELRAPPDWRKAYLGRGRYAEQIRRFLEHFPSSQMEFLLHEDFRERAAETLSAVCEFLGVDKGFAFPALDRNENATRLPRSRRLQALTRRVVDRPSVRSSLQRATMRQVGRLNLRKEPGYPPMPGEVRARLLAYFEPHLPAVTELTGLDTDRWRA